MAIAAIAPTAAKIGASTIPTTPTATGRSRRRSPFSSFTIILVTFPSCSSCLIFSTSLSESSVNCSVLLRTDLPQRWQKEASLTSSVPQLLQNGIREEIGRPLRYKEWNNRLHRQWLNSRYRASAHTQGLIPTQFFLTHGVGRHKEQLRSFELALADAGINRYNLVTVSSIVPPGCRLISREEGTKFLRPGEIVFIVLARNATNEPHRLVASSIGVAIPSRPEEHGYLSEHHSYGQTDESAGDYAEDLAATMLAASLGLEFEVNTNWDEREHIFKTSGRIFKTANVTQSATGDKAGLWTSVVAAAVFIFQNKSGNNTNQAP